MTGRVPRIGGQELSPVGDCRLVLSELGGDSSGVLSGDLSLGNLGEGSLERGKRLTRIAAYPEAEALRLLSIDVVRIVVYGHIQKRERATTNLAANFVPVLDAGNVDHRQSEIAQDFRGIALLKVAV